MGLRKVNTIGLAQANKCMHLSAIAYNLKKYLNFNGKRAKSGAGARSFRKMAEKVLYKLLFSVQDRPKFVAIPT